MGPISAAYHPVPTAVLLMVCIGSCIPTDELECDALVAICEWDNACGEDAPILDCSECAVNAFDPLHDCDRTKARQVLRDLEDLPCADYDEFAAIRSEFFDSCEGGDTAGG